jgi:hypothetical protein
MGVPEKRKGPVGPAWILLALVLGLAAGAYGLLTAETLAGQVGWGAVCMVDLMALLVVAPLAIDVWVAGKDE